MVPLHMSRECAELPFRFRSLRRSAVMYCKRIPGVVIKDVPPGGLVVLVNGLTIMVSASINIGVSLRQMSPLLKCLSIEKS
jgi:hypothetical protein